MVCLTANTPHSWNCKAKWTSWNCTEIASSWKQAVNSTIGHSPLPKDASCMPDGSLDTTGTDREVDGWGGEDGNGGHEVRESNNEAKESNNEVKESSNKMKESGNEAKESGNEARERRAMVNSNDIHVKMASSDGKAGKDKANEGK